MRNRDRDQIVYAFLAKFKVHAPLGLAPRIHYAQLNRATILSNREIAPSHSLFNRCEWTVIVTTRNWLTGTFSISEFNRVDLSCSHTGRLRDQDRYRDWDWYYAETIHTGCVWGQDWIPESHRNIIKTHHLKQFQDLKNGYITYSSLSLLRPLSPFRCSVKGFS